MTASALLRLLAAANGPVPAELLTWAEERGFRDEEEILEARQRAEEALESLGWPFELTDDMYVLKTHDRCEMLSYQSGERVVTITFWDWRTESVWFVESADWLPEQLPDSLTAWLASTQVRR